MNNWWNKYIHIPFKEKGRSIEGCDCYGLGKIIYEQELNLILPSFDNLYEHTCDKNTVSKTIENVHRKLFKNVNSPEPFDFIILNVFGLPMHIGIVTKSNYMIHCIKGIGVSHEKYTSLRWKNKILGFARYDRNRTDTGIFKPEII